MELQPRSITAVQWHGDNIDEVRALLQENVAVLGGFLAVVHLRPDGSAKALLARGPYSHEEESGEYDLEGTGEYKDVVTGFDVNGRDIVESREVQRQVPIMRAVDVPGEWIVIDGDQATVKADVTLREQYHLDPAG